MQDKHLLAQTSSGLKEKTRKLKQLEWDYEVLQRGCEQVSFVMVSRIPCLFFFPYQWSKTNKGIESIQIHPYFEISSIVNDCPTPSNFSHQSVKVPSWRTNRERSISRSENAQLLHTRSKLVGGERGPLYSHYNTYPYRSPSVLID